MLQNEPLAFRNIIVKDEENIDKLNSHAFHNEARISNSYLKVQEAGGKDILIDTERL